MQYYSPSAMSLPSFRLSIGHSHIAHHQSATLCVVPSIPEAPQMLSYSNQSGGRSCHRWACRSHKPPSNQVQESFPTNHPLGAQSCHPLCPPPPSASILHSGLASSAYLLREGFPQRHLPPEPYKPSGGKQSALL